MAKIIKKAVKKVKRGVSKRVKKSKEEACGDCKGTGLQNSHALCPKCQGNGKE